MKRKQLSMAIHGALAVSLLVGAPALAQDAPKAKTKEGEQVTTLESVKVTARKREETLQDVPVAVTAFTAGQLDRLDVKDLSNLDGQVPNLTIYAARGSNTTLTAYIRGVGQSDPLWGVDPGVGLYMDDVYIARPQGALLDVFDVDRIEVLRGPQGTLYGKNTIGGAIKYVSKGLRPDFNGFGSVAIGNYGQRDFKGAIGGSLGGSDALRARVSVARLKNDGFGRNIVTGDRVSDKDATAWRVQLGAYFNDAFDVQFAIDHVKDASGVRGARMLEANRFVPNTPPLASRYDVRNGMPNVNETTMSGASMTAHFRASDDWTWKYVLAKRKSDTETNIDFDTTQAKIADVKAFYSDQQLTNELQANYDAGDKLHGVMGLYSFDGWAGGRVLNNFFNLLFGDTQGKVYTKSYALYADWTYDVSTDFSVDFGVRYTNEEKHVIVLNRGYSDATFTQPVSVAANFDKRITFKNVSPKISLDYRLSQAVMLYGLYTRGFKSGGYNIRAQAVAVPRSANPFRDEKVDSFEVGSKMALLGDSLFLNLAAFHNRYKDIQLSVFTAYDSNGDGTDDAFFGDFTNAGSGTVNGLEIEYQWKLAENWSLAGNLAWLDAKYDRFIYAGVNIASEQKFTNAPRFNGGINLEYRHPAGQGDVFARIGYTYQTDVVATTEILRAEVPPFGRPPISQGPYGLLGATVIWTINPAWTLSLQGSNLLDRRYLTTGYNLNRALGVYTGFYGPPRQVSLSVRYNF